MNSQLRIRASDLSNTYEKSAKFNRFLSNSFKLITILLSTFIGTTGVSTSSSILTYIMATCGFIVAAIGSINAAFSPEKKATIFMKAHIDLMNIIELIDELPAGASIKDLEEKVSQIELDVFTQNKN